MFFRNECNWCKPGFFCGFRLAEEPSHSGCWATNGACSGYGRDSRGTRYRGFYRKFDILMTSCTEKLISKIHYLNIIQLYFNQNFCAVLFKAYVFLIILVFLCNLNF